MSNPLLVVDDLTVEYTTDTDPVVAVSDASLTIEAGEHYGLVGESGCGKSTLIKSLIHGLDENGRIASGEIRFKGEPIQDYSEKEMNNKIRWEEISYIPQSSMNSLDPLQTIRNQAIEIGDVHGYGAQEIEDRLKERFEVMGITPSRITDYPHQFSGGMEQRAIIALSLLLEPSLVIADEPTTALDVIMQDQVMKYLDQMKETAETSVMLVTHDISLVLETCKKMTIMHSGQICESGETVDVFTSPHHPYSALLQQAVPDVRQTSGPLQEIEGTPPLTRNEVNFCTFVDRCPLAVEECRKESPPTEVVGRGEEGTAHVASCFQQDQVEKLKEPERQTVVRNGGEHK